MELRLAGNFNFLTTLKSYKGFLYLAKNQNYRKPFLFLFRRSLQPSSDLVLSNLLEKVKSCKGLVAHYCVFSTLLYH
jgi:hypothetical protein